MATQHHAPWRTKFDLARGDISPVIFNEEALRPIKNLYGRHVRAILATCDYDFLIRHLERLFDYERSSSAIPYAIGVYSSLGDENRMLQLLEDLRKKNNFKKIVFFLFSSDKLDWVLSQQASEESRWDYKINFIRNARYNLIPKFWEFFELSQAEHSISDSSIYVVDLDNKFKSDINSISKKAFGSQKIVFSWNSNQSPNKAFPKTLSGYQREKNKTRINHSYKIVKAGFSIFAPNSLSREFLFLYEFYSIGDNLSSFFVRLFTFYFSDQVAIILSLLELKNWNPKEYFGSISWIDIYSSKIVNLADEKADFMWYPKGVSLRKSN